MSLSSFRDARDNSSLRTEIQHEFASQYNQSIKFNGSEKLVLDQNNVLKKKIQATNRDLANLENELWSFIKNAAEINTERSKELLKQTFSLSSDFIEVLCNLDDKSKILNLCEMSNFLSFKIPNSVQLEIYRIFCSGTYNEDTGTENNDRLWCMWSLYINAFLRSSLTEFSEITLVEMGCTNELSAVIKQADSGILQKIFKKIPFRFKLRCSEDTIASLLIETKKEKIQELKELKFIQMLSEIKAK